MRMSVRKACREPLTCPADVPGTLSALLSFRYDHVWLLLFWPLFGFLFLLMERLLPVEHYALMHAAADDFVPFHEVFLIPYLFWFAELVCVHYTLAVYKPRQFRRMECYVILTYLTAILCYKLWPNGQALRPAALPRDNWLSRAVAFLYGFDTPTNVCPSIHVMGALACWEGVRDCEEYRTFGWKWGFGLATALVCAATVGLKQHSMWDVLAAMPICAAAEWAVYRR